MRELSERSPGTGLSGGALVGAALRWCGGFGRCACVRLACRVKSRWLRGVGVIALASGAPVNAEPANLLSSWNARVWHANDGLPDNRVTGVTQTPDGALWVATRGGLVRFNGSTFEDFDLAAVQGVVGNGLRAMFSDSKGNLWLGAYREAVLRVGPDSAHVFTVADGIPAGEFSGFAEDGKGAIWLVFGGHVCRLSGSRLRELDLPAAAGLGGRASLTCDAKGNVWCAVNGGIGAIVAGRFEPRFRIESRDAVLAAARNGGLWICAGSQVYRAKDDTGLALAVSLPLGVRPLSVLEDRTGALWVGTLAHGLFRYDGQGVERINTSQGDVDTLLEDREGNIWVGTFGGGLNRLRPRAMELLGTQSGLPFESVVSVCQDFDGTFWVVAGDGQLAHGENGTWRIMLFGGGAAACVTADRKHRLWVGTRGQGLREINLLNGQVRTWLQSDGLPSNSVRAVLVAADDSLWFATNGSVSLNNLRQGIVRTLRPPQAVRNIRALVQGAGGEIWIGTSDGQVLRVSGESLIRDPAFEHSAATSVRCLHASADGSLWIGYAERGVGFFKDGRYARLTTAEGVGDDAIWQIASDRFGSLWLAGARGLCRIRLDEAVAVAEGRQAKLHSTLFDYEQGLPSLQPHYDHAPAVWQSTEGRVLFATSLGLLALNPANLRANPVPPPVELERVTIDDREVALRASRFPLRDAGARELFELGSGGQTLYLPPEHRKLEINFAALSYSAPENVRFRYRLDGFDDAWTEPGSARSASYSRLAAGAYVFHVTAGNDAGVWNPTGANLRMVVAPFIWQTWWFRTVLVGAFTVLIVAVVRFLSFQRLRARLRRAEQQAALHKERARIARDIHDDLGGSLAHIKLLSEIAVQDRTLTGAAEEHLRKITSTTRQMLKSLDETIWAINPRNDTLPHLISYLGQHAVEFLRAAGIQCLVDLPDDPPEIAVSSDVRHHVFLVVKETLTNVVRHAEARTVSLRASIADDLLQVTIEDDGCGFERTPDDALADGLRNMRQRMAAVGGEFRIGSKVGSGTRVDLLVPLLSVPGRLEHSSDSA